VVASSTTFTDLETLFAANSLTAHQRLRSLKNEDYPAFLDGAVALFKRGQDSSFHQVVLQLLREDDPCLTQILFAKDRLSLEEAAHLVRIASRLDAGFQVHLVASVKTEIDKAGANIKSEYLARLLEMLVSAIDANRLIPLLTKLCDHEDERLRSKAVLLTGRLARKHSKSSELMRDLDPRVRANAVESLWGRADEDSIAFFREAVKDPHHRVIANAWLGLYLAGDLQAAQGISRLAMDRELPRQLAGIWAIGQTKDQRFNTLIQNMLEAGIGRLKFSLLRAARSLKQRRVELLAKPPFNLTLISSSRGAQGSVRFALLAQNSKLEVIPAEQIRATNCLIHDGDLRVDAFRFSAHGDQMPLQAGFLIPLRTGVEQNFATQLVSAMELGISGKRRSDQWAIHKYEIRPSGGLSANVEFSSQPEILRAEQLRSAKGASENIAAGYDKLLLSYPADGQRKHMVILLDPDLSREPLPDLAQWAERAKRFDTALHVVQCGTFPEENSDSEAAWRKLAESSQGYFLTCEHPGDLPLALRGLCLGLQSSFEISYRLGRIGRLDAPPETVKVEIFSDLGYATLSIDPFGDPVYPAPAHT
jgi:hypothetical protein